MSNSTTPFGLRPVRYYNGAPWNGATQRMYIHALYDTALYVGDPVIQQEELDEKDTSAHYPSIEKVAYSSAAIVESGPIMGVIVGFEPRPADLTVTYMPALTEGWAFVCTDPQVVYHIRDDGGGTPSKVYPGQNAALTDAGGSTVTGLSGFSMEATTPATTVTYPLHILQMANIVGNELDDYAIWEVMLNTPWLTAGKILGVTAA